MSKNVIVTIARQFGSGGREIGEMVAKDLGFEYHDKTLISMAAEKSGLSPEILKNTDEKATPSFLYSIAMGGMPVAIPDFTNGKWIKGRKQSFVEEYRLDVIPELNLK